MDKSEILGFLKSIPPFTLLPNQWVKDLSNVAQVVNYKQNQIIYKSLVNIIKEVLIIVEGNLVTYIEERNGDKLLITHINSGEIYGYSSVLFNNNISIKTLEAKTDVIAISFTDQFFIGLCQRELNFSDFFNHQFGRLMLDQDFRRYVNITQRYFHQYADADNVLTEKVKNLYTRDIVTIEEEKSIKESAILMQDARTGIIIIVNNQSEIVGCVTEATLRDTVAIKGTSAEEKVKVIMETSIPLIDEDYELAEAFNKMFNENIQYLLVSKTNKRYGILSKNKLLSSQSDGPLLFLQSIGSSKSFDDLKERWSNLPDIVFSLINRGVRSEIITSLITGISNKVIKHTIYITLKEMGLPPTEFAFITCGSEGRLEKTLASDQDNALIYEDVDEKDKEMVSGYFLEFATKVCDKLEYVGFKYCSGGFMAKNPRWNQSISAWKSNYDDWYDHPTFEKGMHAVVFIDSKLVYGNKSLFDDLSSHILERGRDASSFFFSTIAQNTLEYELPLTIFRQFKTFKQNGLNVINIKKSMMPIVDLVRIKSIQKGIKSVNTAQRLKDLSDGGYIDRKSYFELLQGYYYMMNLRLKSQSKSVSLSREVGNFVEPKRLTKIERTTLKEILKIVQGYQDMLKLTVLR